MTTEYTAGNEDIGLEIYPRADGMVSLRVLQLDERRVICAIALPPETARSVARNLTLSSFDAEEGSEWQRGQREE